MKIKTNFPFSHVKAKINLINADTSKNIVNIILSKNQR
jgi:hypothetical protein